MATANDLLLLTIEELFSENSHYVIPIYQRNYAWGAAEIEQLIQDIADAAQNFKKTGEQEEVRYYLGSLVVYARYTADNPHKGAIVYEIIDGQQRHTTLSILLAYLKKDVGGNTEYLAPLHLNLEFDSRPKSARTLQNLFRHDKEQSSDPEEPSIRAAFDIIMSYFKAHDDIDISDFCQYLLKHVTILRVPVPKDTDLNHYSAPYHVETGFAAFGLI